MSLILRYTDIRRGGIVFTGNTLGLSKRQDQNLSGTLGSIGAFTSLNNALQVSTFPTGTTANYLQNGSMAMLNLPAGSSVVYAELIWGGLYRSVNSNISNLIDNSVIFTTPLGSNNILPENATKQNLLINTQGQTLGFYVRSANVTSLIQSAMNGSYSVGSVPALIEPLENNTFSTNHAGWTLAVVYSNNTLPLRNLTFWAGGVVVSPDAGSTDITLSGFKTPPVLPITGKLFVSAQEGDAVLNGDQMLFGKNVASLVSLFGPNNPQTNFFCSQINNENGLLDTTGTFGTRNANPFTSTNTSACRQGWDITAIDLSSQLTINQSTASVRFTSSGDLYVPNALALQIDSLGANLELTKSADRSFAEIGQQIEYTVLVKNSGSLTATNVSFDDPIPFGLNLVPGSITVDGVIQADTFPINLGSISAGASKTVKFSVIANQIPVSNPVLNVAKIDYSFEPFAGFVVNSSSNSNIASVFIIAIDAMVEKTVDKQYAVAGDELTYVSVVTNTGTLPIFNLTFTDAIPVGTTFVAGSVEIDDVAFPAYDPSVGFLIPNLSPLESAKVLFKVKVN